MKHLLELQLTENDCREVVVDTEKSIKLLEQVTTLNAIIKEEFTGVEVSTGNMSGDAIAIDKVSKVSRVLE